MRYRTNRHDEWTRSAVRPSTVHDSHNYIHNLTKDAFECRTCERCVCHSAQDLELPCQGTREYIGKIKSYSNEVK